ncbi:MAG: hypothetical protein H7326_00875, partial [Bdellovibrionaceae bacterium]|nr:hypothetical protein [Pseudobdellovibrionaceae bacterium]
MKAALMTAMLFVGQVVGSSASANTACICEMGTEPANQHAGFSAGCSIWLKQQKDCGTIQKVDQGVDYRALNIDPTADTIKIGYVGHWYHSQQLVSYLSLTIAPLMSARAVSVSIDNAACRAMNNPQIVFDYVKGMNLPAAQTLSVRGFQTESMGKWDVVFGKDMSVPAEVSSTAEQIAYP